MNDKMEEQLDQTVKGRFISAMEGVDWATIDQIEAKLNLIPGFWDSIATIEQIKSQWRKQKIRHLTKTVRVDGVPLFASVETMNDEGEVIKIYKNETTFTPEDYKTASIYHSKTGVHHLKMSKYYAEGYERLTDKQIDLPFDPTKLID